MLKKCIQNPKIKKNEPNKVFEHFEIDLIAQRAVRRARVDRSYSSEGHGQRAESREQEEHTGDKREVEGSKMPSGMPPNEPKRAPDSLKQGQGRPKVAPRGAQEGQKSEPNSQNEKRTEPSRCQDHLGVAKGAIRRLFPHRQGGIWAPQKD